MNRTTSSEKQSGKPNYISEKTMNLQKKFDPGKFYSAFSYPQEAGFLQGLSDSKGGWTEVHPGQTCSLCSSCQPPPNRMALTQKAGVVVLVCLILVFHNLLANVLSALVKVFVHAFRPGDWAFLFAVKILPERGDHVWPHQSFLTFTPLQYSPSTHMTLSSSQAHQAWLHTDQVAT